MIGQFYFTVILFMQVCEQLYSMELLIITVNQVIPVTQNMRNKNDSATVSITRSSDWHFFTMHGNWPMAACYF